MSGKQSAELDELLSRQLACLKKYGELVERQRTLIERQDYEGLLAVLAKKEKVIARMGDPARLKELAVEKSSAGQKQREQTGRLFEELIAKLDFFAAAESESMEKASGLKAELAANIFALRKGKRMLRKYSHAPMAGKARFKDIKG
ncbi:MAG: hypothetical protein FVQ81_14000 [Candidatus Glassbacteria bacterium]|nr:hypothetical protein [Candidatus Glassbacteria bacterium]